MGLLDFHSSYKITFADHLKQSSFCHVKHTPNNLVHEMSWQCTFALSMCTIWSMSKLHTLITKYQTAASKIEKMTKGIQTLVI